MSGKVNSKNKKTGKRKSENRKTENIKNANRKAENKRTEVRKAENKNSEVRKAEKKSEVSAEVYGRRTQHVRRKVKKPWYKKRKYRTALFGLVLVATLVMACAIIYAFRSDEPKMQESVNTDVSNVPNVSEKETLKIGEVSLSTETVSETTTAAASPDEKHDS